MQTDRREQNPFDMVKASDFTDEEILDHWVDIAGEPGRLEHLVKPLLIMPMLLLGGKGSGKTHLMRYLSAPVQAARRDGSLLKAIEQDGYLGVYIRAAGLNTLKFAGRGQTAESWSAVFSMYFEIWLAISLLEHVRLAFRGKIDPLISQEFASLAASLFDGGIDGELTSLEGVLEYLIDVRKSVDFIVNNAALTRDIAGLSINFSPGALVYGLPEIISRVFSDFGSVLFVYLIDEVENLTAEQQQFLNTLIRYRKGNASIKIGARLYGIRTYNTLGVGEPIKQDAEYERVELDAFLRDDHPAYQAFCKKLIVRRLEYHHVRGPRLSADEVSSCFAELDSSNFSREATLAVVSASDKEQRERPYFARLRRLLRDGGYEGALADRMISALRVEGYPLLEKLALFAVYRSWRSDPAELLRLAEETGRKACAIGAGDRTGGEDLIGTLGYFRSDLMAQLYRDCRRSNPYAGLPTLIHLSQGIPRNLLSILKHIYRRSLFLGERPFSGGQISVEAQSLGVKDSASWFWDDAQPDSQGHQVREAIELLATFFRTMRYSDRPPECDCATFSTRLETLTPVSRDILMIAENWSYLIRIRDGASDKNSDSVNAKYQLGPMLAPRWGVSEHRRGTVEIAGELANAIFDPSARSSLQQLFRARANKWLGERFVKARSNGQERLPI